MFSATGWGHCFLVGLCGSVGSISSESDDAPHLPKKPLGRMVYFLLSEAYFLHNGNMSACLPVLRLIHLTKVLLPSVCQPPVSDP